MAQSPVREDQAKTPPPRERILAAASDLFYHHGIKAVGVEAIAEAAGTNKMTLYRHFSSKDELVAEYLRRLAANDGALCCELERRHPNDARAQLHAWLAEMARHVGCAEERGCPLANAAIELAEKEHPVRRVVEECKTKQRAWLIDLCRRAQLAEPESLADELFLVIEGARVTAQSMGPEGPSARLVRMGEVLIAAHDPKRHA